MIPKSVEVFGHTYAVQHAPDPILGDGCAVHGDQIIYVNQQLHGEKQRETLVHEMVEAANDIANLELSHHQITVLGMFIFQSFK
jgi:hypothetical protein